MGQGNEIRDRALVGAAEVRCREHLPAIAATLALTLPLA